MADMLYIKYMNAEDAMIAQEGRPNKGRSGMTPI